MQRRGGRGPRERGRGRTPQLKGTSRQKTTTTTTKEGKREIVDGKFWFLRRRRPMSLQPSKKSVSEQYQKGGKIDLEKPVNRKTPMYETQVKEGTKLTATHRDQDMSLKRGI